MLARATVRNMGSKSRSASRVAGSEPLNITTPNRPLHHPLPAESFVAAKVVILLSIESPLHDCSRRMVVASFNTIKKIVMHTFITPWLMPDTRRW